MSTFYQNLLQNTVGDGARSAKWESVITFTNKELFPNEQDLGILIKTAAFPGRNYDIINMPFKGRTIPIKGQGKFNQIWDANFYLTEDHALRKSFEDWLEALDEKHNYSDNLSDVINSTKKIHKEQGYTSQIIVQQLNFDLDEVRSVYILHNCFPIEMSEVAVDYEGIGENLTFSVKFAYSYYEHFVVPINKSISDVINETISGVVNSVVSGVVNAAEDIAGGLFGDDSININSITTSISKTANTVSKQIVSGVEDMASSLEDIFKK